MKYNSVLLVVSIMLLGLQACKTDAPVFTSKITVVGKWYIRQHNLKLIKDGAQVGETIRTSYTKDDFIQFFADGTGYQSKQNSPAASLSTFHYTLKNNIITMYTDGAKGVDETITKLTENELSVHYESPLPDPVVEGKFNTEIDDYAFTKEL
ncbi:lipocalin family protein [Mucilaginibacter sp. L3T2-6]|uniref:lipocalin family protein n=1 Tax=Mucilaginibacter sp. L3T2-6 TaxID=3062491 RepID=UPI002676130D|nr:lipocalin family protein [Mucilaginibacter sp. L3T2-6]MDO3644715.1 lipocalin family protein [Mucilaginibacter sp. L3T2-6]MDV6217167.1 lipocalin family protein [Mucilaginibacter sp. L3T2-6]